MIKPTLIAMIQDILSTQVLGAHGVLARVRLEEEATLAFVNLIDSEAGGGGARRGEAE